MQQKCFMINRFLPLYRPIAARPHLDQITVPHQQVTMRSIAWNLAGITGGYYPGVVVVPYPKFGKRESAVP